MNKEILKKFLSNQCSYQESESVARFLEENEIELDKIDIFENLEADEIIHIPQFEKDNIFISLIPIEKKTFDFKRLLIAAAILIFAIFSFYKLGFEDKPVFTNSISWINIINSESSSKWYLLPDSSRIKLGPNAHVAYRKNFVGDRELEQKMGEVTYYVYPDKKSPFRVINQGVQTRAVGTIFTISDYNNQNLIISLLEGKIVLEDYEKEHSDQIFLNERSTVIVNKEDLTYKVVEEKKSSYKKAWEVEQKYIKTKYPISSISWSNQVVDFSGVSNTDLFSIMERLFSVTIDVENPEIMNGNFTGQLYQNDKIEDLLNNFCQINGCVFTIEDNIIRIK